MEKRIFYLSYGCLNDFCDIRYSLHKLQKDYESKKDGQKKKQKHDKKRKKGESEKNKKIIKKKENDDDSSFKLDVKDTRFSSLFNNSEFSIDPTNPNFKNTQGSADLLAARHKHYAESKVPHHEQSHFQYGVAKNAAKKKGRKRKKAPGGSGGVQDVGLRTLIGKFKAKSRK